MDEPVRACSSISPLSHFFTKDIRKFSRREIFYTMPSADSLVPELARRRLFDLEPVLPKQAQHVSTREQQPQAKEAPEHAVSSADDSVMSLNNPPKNLWRYMCACILVFTAGMSDGALGALLPHIEAYYNVSYAVVALLWLGNAVAYITIAFTNHYIDSFLGLQKSLSLSMLLYCVMFSIIASGTHFPVLVVAYFIGGLGGAMALSQYNIFMSKLHNSSKWLGICHGGYGIGATISPLVGTALVNAGVPWHFFYLIPLGMSIMGLIITPLAFMGAADDLKKWDKADDSGAAEETQDDNELREFEEVTTSTVAQVTTRTSTEEEPKHDFRSAMKDHRSWLTCAFIFFYQGSEVAIGGWMVTYLLEYRGGNAESVGYVAAGFWGGVALGRFFLTQPLTKLGVRRSVLVLMALIVGLDLIAWQVPNLIVEAVCSSIIGLLIGPMYPLNVSILTKMLPRKIRFCAMTLGTAFGSSGGSAIPFCVGMASQYAGTYVLHPIFLACYFFMAVTWICMPNVERKGAQTTWLQRLW